MKTKIASLVIFLLIGITAKSQVISIDSARSLPLGTVVTVSGVVTNGSELGIIRYFQDQTGGLCAYSSTLSTVNRGDSITIKGTLKSYNNLLEMDPVTSIVVHKMHKLYENLTKNGDQ